MQMECNSIQWIKSLYLLELHYFRNQRKVSEIPVQLNSSRVESSQDILYICNYVKSAQWQRKSYDNHLVHGCFFILAYHFIRS